MDPEEIRTLILLIAKQALSQLELWTLEEGERKLRSPPMNHPIQN
jgi:hypothetical protein